MWAREQICQVVKKKKKEEDVSKSSSPNDKTIGVKQALLWAVNSQKDKQPKPFLWKVNQPCRVAGGGEHALTAPCARSPGWSCDRVSTAAARWKCRWRPGWGQDWWPAPRWFPVRRAALRGSRASPAVISCQLSRPPSGSESRPRRWRGRAGGCDLSDKIQRVKQRGLIFTYSNHFSSKKMSMYLLFFFVILDGKWEVI